jgi:hypothetical protein
MSAYRKLNGVAVEKSSYRALSHCARQHVALAGRGAVVVAGPGRVVHRRHGVLEVIRQRPAVSDKDGHVLAGVFVLSRRRAGYRVNDDGAQGSANWNGQFDGGNQRLGVGRPGAHVRHVRHQPERHPLPFDVEMPPPGDQAVFDAANAFRRDVDDGPGQHFPADVCTPAATWRYASIKPKLFSDFGGPQTRWKAGPAGNNPSISHTAPLSIAMSSRAINANCLDPARRTEEAHDGEAALWEAVKMLIKAQTPRAGHKIEVERL